ncbi:MAG: glycosyltransferase family 2 protein [Actinomycetota bacterium]|nr:glycosyltransferase family 2 protein [Actinomycetota bacterium]
MPRGEPVAGCAVEVQRIGIVVPAKNEANLIVDCLTALAVAALRVAMPVTASIVVDDCTDTTPELVAGASIALELDLHLLEIRAGSVGEARRVGMAEMVARLGVTGTWLATTDADSMVPPHWLARQLAHARGGATVVAGTVEVADWSSRSAGVRRSAEEAYEGTNRRHVHGANLGLHAESYLGVGGFQALERNEDVALVAALARAGELIAWAEDLAVTTSSRRLARAPGGFAAYLDALDLDHSSPLAVRATCP